MMFQEAMNFNIENQVKINKVCSPLENSFNINLIHFRRFYLTGGLVSIFNHSKWMEISFENQYWYSTVLLKKLRTLVDRASYVYLWPTNPIDDPIYKGLYDNNLWNGITIYKRFSDCVESYAFATTRENINAVSFYLSEMGILEHFISYFRSKVFPSLLGSVEKDILVPFSFQLPSTDGDKDNKNRQQFFSNTAVNNYYMRIGGADVKISKREEECLALLSIGMKVKEVAHHLKLSSRTVESYIEQARTKTGSCTTSQLLNIYKQNSFSDRNFNAGNVE